MKFYTVFSVSCNRFFSLTVAGYYLPNRVFCLHLFVSFACHYFTIPFASLFYLEIQGVFVIGKCGMKLDIEPFKSV